MVRDAVAHYPVAPFLAIRFALASLVLAPAALRGWNRMSPGFAPGIVLAVGYLCQTVGLTYTTPSQAGLLTGLFVVITPLLVYSIARSKPPIATVAAVVAATIGTALLAGTGGASSGSRQGMGDGLEILTAVAFSVHIFLLSRIAAGASAAAAALAQMLAAAVLFALIAAVSGGFPAPTASVWFALAVTGVLASAVAFLIQTYVQQRISPTRTAIILACEPAFATLFGVSLAGDRFAAPQAAGAALIIVALLWHESVPMLRASRR